MQTAGNQGPATGRSAAAQSALSGANVGGGKKRPGTGPAGGGPGNVPPGAMMPGFGVVDEETGAMYADDLHPQGNGALMRLFMAYQKNPIP
jgi:hypothetical protein